MKKSIFAIALLLLSFNVFSQSTFDASNIRAGVGLFYATEISGIGLNFNGVYAFDETWEGAIAFSHVFEKDQVTWNILDLDGHYIFYDDGSAMNLYGLAGLSFTFWKVTVPGISIPGVSIPEQKATGSDVGFNLGVGMNYALSERLNLAPEMRFTIIDGSYLRIGASVQYKF